MVATSAEPAPTRPGQEPETTPLEQVRPSWAASGYLGLRCLRKNEHGTEQSRRGDVGGHSCHSTRFWGLRGVFKTAERCLLKRPRFQGPPRGFGRRAGLRGLSEACDH